MPIASPVLPDWPRACGEPIFSGRIKQIPEDFKVVEELGWELSGDGEHDYLWVEKTGQNTAWVATQLARHADVPARDVGYSGLKDRHAVTKQWFSVRRPTGEGTNWGAFGVEGIQLVDIQRHQKKLKRGVHCMNRFSIVVRDVDADAAPIDERLSRISTHGVPNYFGPQRFGRDGGNLELAAALFDGRRMKRQQRSIAISAARSFMFNEVLAERVRRDTWKTWQPGDVLNLDGSSSIFPAQAIDQEIEQRVKELDLHPAVSMWAEDADNANAEHQVVAARHPGLAAGLSGIGLGRNYRALRLAIADLEWTLDEHLTLDFGLSRGSYATAVLRELMTGTHD